MLLAPINILEASRFREGIDRLGHNQVIEHANVDKPKGFAETSGDELVRSAGLGEARRVIVIQDHGGGVSGQHGLDDFTRVN